MGLLSASLHTFPLTIVAWMMITVTSLIKQHSNPNPIRLSMLGIYLLHSKHINQLVEWYSNSYSEECDIGSAI